MKTRGLMLMAFLFSSTAFAQSADVKTEQTTKVNAKAQSGNEGTTVSGSAKVKSDTKANAANESTQSTVALKKDASAKTKTVIETGDNLATEAGHAVNEEINAGIETGNTIAAQAGHTIKNTLSSSAGISGSLMNATRIKTGPVRINTQIISRSGLIIR